MSNMGHCKQVLLLIVYTGWLSSLPQDLEKAWSYCLHVALDRNKEFIKRPLLFVETIVGGTITTAEIYMKESAL